MTALLTDRNWKCNFRVWTLGPCSPTQLAACGEAVRHVNQIQVTAPSCIMAGWSPYVKEYDPLKCGSIDGTDTEPHDHAVYRAMQATYRPNKNVCTNPETSIFVARLSPDTSEKTLREFFSRYGEISFVRLVRDLVTGFSKCYAFVEYKTEWEAEKARRDANGEEIDNHVIFVEYELERKLPGWIPRRFGGGLGGKKEAGQLRFGGRDRPFRKPILLQNLSQDRTNRPFNYDRRDREYSYSRHRNERDHRTDRRKDKDSRKGSSR